MNNNIFFTEQQRFKQWWIWIPLLIINIFIWYGIFRQVVVGQPFGDKPASDSAMLAIGGWISLFTLFFLSMRLETRIQQDGIYVRFFPFHLKYKHYTWDSLSRYYIRDYSAITEFGGYGIRYSLFGKGRAYNVSGNKGLQLEFTDGKKLLIGTNMPDELGAALDRKERRS